MRAGEAMLLSTAALNYLRRKDLSATGHDLILRHHPMAC